MALPTNQELIEEFNRRGIFPLDFEYQYHPDVDPNTTAVEIVDSIIRSLAEQS
jgi:hypothetical protein